MRDIPLPVFVIGFLIATVAFIFLPIKALSLIFDNVPVIVKVGEKEVYKGISACVNVTSTGDTTRVDISGGFLCMFPVAYYVGKDIQLIGDKR